MGGALIWKQAGGAGKAGKSPAGAGRATLRIMNSRIVIAIFPTDVLIVHLRVRHQALLTGTMADLAGQKLALDRVPGLLRVLHPAPDPRRESGPTDCRPTALVEVHPHHYTPVVMGHQTSATCVTVLTNRPTFVMTPPVIVITVSAPSIGGTRQVITMRATTMIHQDHRIMTTAVTTKEIVMDPGMNLPAAGLLITTVQSLRDNCPYHGVRARRRPIQLGPLLNPDYLRHPLPLLLNFKYGILQSPSRSQKSPLRL
jgi:hypothetical protein